MIDTSIKFGVVHTSPASLITNAASLEEGKLYFAAGDPNGVVKQGVYGVVGLTTDGSIVIDGTGADKTVAMFGTGAIADGNGYGLSQYNFDSSYKTKLDGITEGANKGVTSVSAGLGLVGGDITTTGTIKVNLVNEDENISDASATDSDSANRLYPVQLDKSGKLAVNVPWLAKATNASYADSATNASTAEVANKLAKKLSINVIDFDGSEDVSLLVEGDGQTIDVSTNDSSIVIKAITNNISVDSNALTTGAQVASYVSTELGKLSGALIYKDVITEYSQLPAASDSNIGHVYICSSEFETTAEQTGVKYRIEVGDMFISNGEKWNIVSSEFDVSTYDATLAWGSDVSIAVVDGVTIKAKLPPYPNTDERVKANTSTGTIYLIGQDDASNGTTESVYKNANVYMSNGALYANSGAVADNDGALVSGGIVYAAVEAAKEAATIYWETL